jgi:mannose-6-phosphate isomerase-like protein (cupin superfamily)
MQFNRATQVPVFELPGITFTALASPTRGSSATSVWRIRILPNTPGTPHALTDEETFHVLSGHATVVAQGASQTLAVGDTLVVPAGTEFELANPFDEPFEAIAVAPCGVQAIIAGGSPFAPPWTL